MDNPPFASQQERADAVAPTLTPKERAALRLCVQCHSVAKPRTANVAIKAFSIWLLGVLLAVLSATGGSTQQIAEYVVLHALLLAAVLYPRVCRACQSSRLVPFDSPRAKALTART